MVTAIPDDAVTDDVLILAMHGKTYGDPDVWAAACRVLTAHRIRADPQVVDWTQVHEGWYPDETTAHV